MPPPLSIGIDLGTTNCCVAVVRRAGKNPEVIPNDCGKNITPSYVAYDKDEEIIVGVTAKDLAHENPQNTIFDVKRLIGRSFYDPHVQKYRQLWPFHLDNYKGLVGIEIRGKILLPQEIAKELLKHLVTRAEEFLGSKVTSAVITVPAYFNSLQKELTREACVSAGLEQVQFISEPTAAAFAYGLDCSSRLTRQKSTSNLPLPSIEAKPKTCLVFDLGGGTFDVALLKLGSGGTKVEIFGIGGDARLGGEDFNDILVEYVIKEFKDKEGIDLSAGKTSEDKVIRKKTARILRRIRKACEEQKCYLSSQKTVVISLDGIHEETVLSIRLKRAKFEELIADHLARCINIVEAILKEKRVTKEGIDDVVLIGGSSRIPKVQEMVSEFFGGKKMHRNIDADEAVAYGAAIHAFNIFNSNPETPGSGITVSEKYENIGCYASVYGHESDNSVEAASPDPQRSDLPKERDVIVAVALRSYESDEIGKLSLKPGDVITKIEKIDDVIWSGKCKGKEGQFPAKYVAEIKDYKPYYNQTILLKAPSLLSDRDEKQVVPKQHENIGLPKMPNPQNSERKDPPKSNPVPKAKEAPSLPKHPTPQKSERSDLLKNTPIAKKPEIPKDVKPSSSKEVPSSSPTKVFVQRREKPIIAKVGFQARNENEISFGVGDLITDIEKTDGEMWKGRCKGKMGFFPKDFATLIKRN